jgi:hypothetical protein
MNGFLGDFIEQGLYMRLPPSIRFERYEAMDQRHRIDRFRAWGIDRAEHEIELPIGGAAVPERISKLLAPVLDVGRSGRWHLHLDPLDVPQLPLTLSISRNPGDGGPVNHRTLRSLLSETTIS